LRKSPKHKALAKSSRSEFTGIFTEQRLLFAFSTKNTFIQAEIDYLIQIQGEVIPVEVKAGLGRTIKSLRYFLEKHPKSTYGIRFSAQNYSLHEHVFSYPLYAIAHVFSERNEEVKQAIQKLLVR
jgi:hypothetical protein